MNRIPLLGSSTGELNQMADHSIQHGGEYEIGPQLSQQRAAWPERETLPLAVTDLFRHSLLFSVCTLIRQNAPLQREGNRGIERGVSGTEPRAELQKPDLPSRGLTSAPALYLQHPTTLTPFRSHGPPANSSPGVPGLKELEMPFLGHLLLSPQG